MLFKKKTSNRPRMRKATSASVSIEPDVANDKIQSRRSSSANSGTHHNNSNGGIKSLAATFFSRLGVMIIIVGVGVLGYFLLRLDNRAVIKPVPNDYQLILRDPSVYQQSADKYLSESILNRSKITINATSVSQSMLQKYPELANVYFSFPLNSYQPILNVEAAPVALVLSGTSGVYAIGYDGKALASTDEIPSIRSMKLPKIGDSSGLDITPGKQALSSDNVHFITNTIKILQAKSIKVVSVAINNSSSELDVNFEGKPYTVKFNLQSDTPKEQVGTLLATIKQLQKDNVEPGKYIDIRIPGRSYYQ